MLEALNISTSALVAQRIRLDAISSNIANLSTTHNEEGQAAPYEPRFVVFKADADVRSPEGAMGVKVDSVEISQQPPLWRYQPGNPDAQTQGPHKGYVAYPDIDMNTEFVDSLNATRAYEANVGVMEATKNMFSQALKIVG